MGQVGRLRRDLGLPAIRPGPSVRFKPDHVMAWIEECRDQPRRSGEVGSVFRLIFADGARSKAPQLPGKAAKPFSYDDSQIEGCFRLKYITYF
jgi:hypothetical protein